MPKIKTFKAFKDALRPYEVEGGFGANLETGFEAYYGLSVGVKIQASTAWEAWEKYQAYPDRIDARISEGSFLLD